MRLKYRNLRFKNESMVAQVRSMGNGGLLPGLTFVGFPNSLDLNDARLALTYQNRLRKELLDLIDPSRLVGCLLQLIIKRPREPDNLGGEIKRRKNEPEPSCPEIRDQGTTKKTSFLLLYLNVSIKVNINMKLISMLKTEIHLIRTIH